jgi:hypothetical protein
LIELHLTKKPILLNAIAPASRSDSSPDSRRWSFAARKPPFADESSRRQAAGRVTQWQTVHKSEMINVAVASALALYLLPTGVD